MNLTPEAQCAANVFGWLRAHSSVKFILVRSEADRCWLQRTTEAVAAVQRLCADGVITEAYAKNHGPTVEVGYRETKTFCAAQIIIHRDLIEFDFDHFRPWDVVGLIGHGIEVLRNKIGKKKTDPFEIAKRLRGRGINA